MNGPVYLMTGATVKAILNSTQQFKAIPIEDMLFTGIIGEHIKANKIDSWKFFRSGKVYKYYFIIFLFKSIG